MNTKHTGDHRHRTEIRVSPRNYDTPTTWTAFCECGWVGYDNPSRRDAENDADEHVRLM